MSKHTDGPWKVEQFKGKAAITTVDNVCTVACVYGDEGSNARLIASAPELLSALKTVTAVLIELTSSSDVCDDEIAQARASIQKAEGKEG